MIIIKTRIKSPRIKYLPAMQQVHHVGVKEVVDMVDDEMVENTEHIDPAQLGEQYFEHVVVRLEELTFYSIVIVLLCM